MELLLRAQGRKGKSPPPLSHERERERNKSCMNNWKCRLPILDIPASGFIPLIQNPRLQSANTTNCLLNSKALETKTLLAQAFCYRRLTPCCAIRSSENRRDREFYEFCTMHGCTVRPCRAALWKQSSWTLTFEASQWLPLPPTCRWRCEFSLFLWPWLCSAITDPNPLKPQAQLNNLLSK